VEQNSVREAEIWFINRFIDTQTNRNFSLRLNELAEMTTDEAKKLRANRYRMGRFDFRFIPTENYVIVQPNTEEAEWARGVIWIENNEFQFRTTGLPSANIAIPTPGN
jgi:hypothetical protein